MIIPDTSVWIEFLKGNPKYNSKIVEILETNNLLALECIFAELLQGVRNKRERNIILSYWQHLPKIDGSGLFIEAGLFSNSNKLSDKGVGLIDALIAISTLKSNSMLWTLDKKLIKNISDNLIYKP